MKLSEAFALLEDIYAAEGDIDLYVGSSDDPQAVTGVWLRYALIQKNEKRICILAAPKAED